MLWRRAALRSFQSRRAVRAIRAPFSSGGDKPKPDPEEEARKAAALAKAQKEGLVSERKRNFEIVTPWFLPTPDKPTVIENAKDIGDAEGMPEWHRKRLVTIWRKPQSHMQSAPMKSYSWHLKWAEQARWVNPLMGWRSSSDPMNVGTDLQFDTPEQAIKFCEKRGWRYVVEDLPPKKLDMGVTTYAHNFLPKNVEGSLRKEGRKNKIWHRPGAGKSHYFRPLEYHGTTTVPQHGRDPDKKV